MELEFGISTSLIWPAGGVWCRSDLKTLGDAGINFEVMRFLMSLGFGFLKSLTSGDLTTGMIPMPIGLEDCLHEWYRRRSVDLAPNVRANCHISSQTPEHIAKTHIELPNILNQKSKLRHGLRPYPFQNEPMRLLAHPRLFHHCFSLSRALELAKHFSLLFQIEYLRRRRKQKFGL